MIVERLLKVLVLLPALLFTSMGVRWLVSPAGVAPQLGLQLDQGLGLSTQIGDLSAFFLTLGICMLAGLVSQRRAWIYPAILLLGLAAFGRIVAWLVHDAALATAQIVPEIVVASILLLATRFLPERN